MNGCPSAQGPGHLESYVGNRQIIARTLEALDQGRSSTILAAVGGQRNMVTPKVIAEEAQKGDALALEIFDFVARCLASTFASVTYLLQPQAFVVGGGVSLSGDILFDPLKTYLKENLNPAFSERVEVLQAALENQAGMIGSATLGMFAV
jgi:glucokinase